MKFETDRLQIAAAISLILLMTVSTIAVGVRADYNCQLDVQTWGNQNSSAQYPAAFQYPLNCLASSVPTPKSYLGYDLATNGTFTPWAQVVGYFMKVANSSASSRVKVYQFGTSSYGRPMIIGVITSPFNWFRMSLNKKNLNALSDPVHTTPAQAQALIQFTLPVVWLQAHQHLGEAGSVEEAMEMLYLMAASNDPSVMNILNHVVFIIDPSVNPDGHDQWVSRHYATSGMGYHGIGCPTPPYCAFCPTGQTYYTNTPPFTNEYASHDNNRDWFAQALIENWYNGQAFLDWHPQIFEDHHEDNGYGRLYTPPDPDTINPNVSPIIRAGWNEIGMHIAAEATTADLPGFNQGYSYDMWYPGYGDTWPSFHNAIGMTFETARSLYNLAPGSAGTDTTPFTWERQGVRWNYQYPWCAAAFMGQPSGEGTGVGAGSGTPGSGCYWTLEDNNNYQELATWSDLEFAANLGPELLWSYYQAGALNVQFGESYPPYAFVVPPSKQNDLGTMQKMLNRFLTQGVEVDQANSLFTVSNACSINQNTCGGSSFPAGSYVIRMNQPLRGYAKTMLELQDYPHNVQDENGNFISGGSSEATNGGVSLPYDVTGWTEPLTMDVQTWNVTDPSVLSVSMSPVSSVVLPAGGIVPPVGTPYGYAFTHNMNNALTVMNRLLQAGFTLYETQSSFTQGAQTFAPGTVIVTPVTPALSGAINTIGQALFVPIYPIQAKPAVGVYKVTLPKIGVLYKYSGVGYDEGWTRWLLDHGPQSNYNRVALNGQNEFTYTRLNPLSIDTGYVNGTGAPISSFNVIILPPSISPSGGGANSTSSPPFYQSSCTSITNYAPELGVAQGHVFSSTYTCPNYDPGVPIPQGGNTANPLPQGEQLGIDQYGKPTWLSSL